MRNASADGKNKNKEEALRFLLFPLNKKNVLMNNEMNKIAFSLLTFFPVGIQTNSTASSLYSCGMLTVGNITLYTPAVQLTVAFACARSTCKFPTYPDFASSVEFVCDQVITSVSLV